jgi:Tol biopolymer transport system component
MFKGSISRRGAFAALAGLALVAGLARAAAPTPHTYLISAGPPGEAPAPLLTHANLTSEYARTSYDGLRTVFTSDATNLDPALVVGGDYIDPAHPSQGSWDVFLRVTDPLDSAQGSTYLVSSTVDSTDIPYDPANPTLVAAGAAQKQSAWATISRDGKWIAFQSDSDEIVYASSPYTDIFLLSADDVVNRVMSPQRSTVSKRGSVKANGPSGNPSFKVETRTFVDPYPPAVIYLKPDTLPCVVYQSEASNLDPAFGDANGRGDLFVWCRQTGEGSLGPNTNRLLTRAANGAAIDGSAWSPSVSYDGRYVAFVSDASNLVPRVTGMQIYLMDRDPDGDGNLNNSNPSYTLVSRTRAGAAGNGESKYPSISASGNFVAFTSAASNLETQKNDFDLVTPINDTNGKVDVYLYNQRARQTELVSVRMSASSESASSEPISGLPRLLQRDSYAPSISADGRYVVYKTLDNYVTATRDFNLNQADYAPDIFMYDRLAAEPTTQTVKISLAEDGSQTDVFQTSFPVISGNKRFVDFTTEDRCFPVGHFFGGYCHTMTSLPRNIMARDLGPAVGEAALGIDPAGASFLGGMPVSGGDKTLIFTLKNWGSASLTIDSLAILPGDHAKDNDFQFVLPNSCSGLTAELDPAIDGLATNDTCAFAVLYAPQMDGWYRERKATLTVYWHYDGESARVDRSDSIALEGGPLTVFLPMLRR